jgi:hypothetical protein
MEKSLALVGNRTPTVQPVARRYTDWTIKIQKYAMAASHSLPSPKFILLLQKHHLQLMLHR